MSSGDCAAHLRPQRLRSRDFTCSRSAACARPATGCAPVTATRSDGSQGAGKPGLPDASRGWAAAEWTESRGHGRRLDKILDRRYHRHVGIDLHVPAARLHALDSVRKSWAGDTGIIDAPGCEIEPDAANAGLAHQVEIALRRLVVDHGDPARGRSPRRHAE